MTVIKPTATAPRKRSKKKAVEGLPTDPVETVGLASERGGPVPHTDTDDAPLDGEFIGKEDAGTGTSLQALVSADAASGPDDDEAVVRRVEHLNHSVGWVLISAGVVGLIVPGVLGTPFLIMGALALWPGNHKRVERWRQGHSPKAFHGAMKQINRFLDDLEKRYPRINKP